MRFRSKRRATLTGGLSALATMFSPSMHSSGHTIIVSTPRSRSQAQRMEVIYPDDLSPVRERGRSVHRRQREVVSPRLSDSEDEELRRGRSKRRRSSGQRSPRAGGTYEIYRAARPVRSREREHSRLRLFKRRGNSCDTVRFRAYEGGRRPRNLRGLSVSFDVPENSGQIYDRFSNKRRREYEDSSWARDEISSEGKARRDHRLRHRIDDRVPSARYHSPVRSRAYERHDRDPHVDMHHPRAYRVSRRVSVDGGRVAERRHERGRSCSVGSDCSSCWGDSTGPEPMYRRRREFSRLRDIRHD